MEIKIREFLRVSETARLRLFYYAGHGFQVDGHNYLMPVSAKLDWAGALNFETVALDSLLTALDTPSHANIIILDACRNNPFAQTLASKSGAAGRGLAPAQHGLAGYANVGAGTLVAFSTAPDKVALDGSGANSPFTEALARHLRTKGLEVRQMLTRVRADVATETRGMQIPWDNSALLGDVYLAGAGTPPPPESADDIMWGAIKDSTVAAVFDEFVNRFPMSPHVRDARARADELKKNTVAMLPPGAGTAPGNLADTSSTAPAARFMRSNNGWQMSVSFADPVTAISWRTEESQNFRETGFMDMLDPRTRRRIPNPMFDLDEDQKATIIWVRAIEVNGGTRDPSQSASTRPRSCGASAARCSNSPRKAGWGCRAPARTPSSTILRSCPTAAGSGSSASASIRPFPTAPSRCRRATSAIRSTCPVTRRHTSRWRRRRPWFRSN